MIEEDLRGTLDWLSKKPSSSPGTTVAHNEDTISELGTDGEWNTSASTDDEVGAVDVVAPPLWHGWSLPGDQVVLLAASPDDAFSALLGFFEHGVRAVVKQQGWEMNATAFVGCVAVDAVVQVYVNVDPVNHAAVVIRHASQSDIVRFCQLVASAKDYLWAEGVPLTMPDGTLFTPTATTLAVDFDCSEDILMDELEMDWPQCATSAFEEVSMESAARAGSRETALQMLASWATRRPESRTAIADAMGTHSHVVEALLCEDTPLAELYPLAVTQRFAAPESMVQFIAEMLPSQAPRLPASIVEELQEAFKTLPGRNETGAAPRELE